MTIEDLKRAISGAWCRQTSADGEGWHAGNPAHGQCAVVALVVQDELGGDLLRTMNEGVSHYFNRLPSGVEVDLTRDQFERWEPGEVVVRDRDYVLSFPATAARYAILRERIDNT